MFLSFVYFFFFFFQAEDGIRDAQESRGLGDVYKRQILSNDRLLARKAVVERKFLKVLGKNFVFFQLTPGCLLYTSDAADDLLCVDLGGRRIIKKKK